MAGGPAIDVKRLLLLSLVLFAVPVASMAYLGGLALDADRLARIELERDMNRVVARETVDDIQRDYLTVEDEVFEACQSQVVPLLLADDADAAREAMDSLRQQRPLIDRVFVADPEGRLDIPRNDPPFLPDGQNFEEVHSSIALARSLEDAEPQRAEDIYRALRSGTNEAVAWEAKVELAALYFRQGRWEQSRDCLEGLREVPARRRALGLPVPLEAALLLGYIELGSGHSERAAQLLERAGRELLDGVYPVSREEFESAWKKLAETAISSLPEVWTRLLVARQERFAALDFARELQERVYPVVEYGASAELQFEHVSRHGEENRLYAFCHVPRGDRPPLVLGFRVDLHGVAERIVVPRLQPLSSRSVLVRMRDSADRVVFGIETLAYETAAVESFPELFPFWRVEILMGRVSHNTGLSRSILGLIAMAAASVLACFFAVYKFVSKSQEFSHLRDEFISNVTHELKTPLTSIRMFSEMLTLGRIKNEARRQQYYHHIHEESQRLHQLVQNILDFSRMEAGRKEFVFESCDLRPLLEETIDLFRFSAKGFQFDAEIESELPKVDIDRDAFSSALLNLLTNAVKYSKDRKSIALRACCQKGAVRIEVSDSGIGIAPDDLKKIFERYYRARTEQVREIAGSGLGLSLVKYITEAHGGHVEVTSKPGEGSTFTLVIPV